MNCSNHNTLLFLLKENFASNSSAWNEVVEDNNGCDINVPQHRNTSSILPRMFELAMDFYGYASPAIVIIGLLGNSISLKVFTSKVMRRLSCSYYLSFMSASDMLVLLTYVFMDWLDKGLPRWPGQHKIPIINYQGACHIFLYLSYATRFSSVWLIVAFTGERYVAICHPKFRKKLCSKAYARKITMAVCVTACIVCLYKPLLSGSYSPSDASAGGAGYNHTKGFRCVRNPSYAHLSYVLDATFSLFLTAVPSMLISGFSAPILRRLIAKREKQKESRLIFRENRIRLEFTVILLSISSCFVALTIPYMVTWSVKFWLSVHADVHTPEKQFKVSGLLFITRTIFYLNFCINFFLYCLTGAYYRREIMSLLKFNAYFRGKRSGSFLNGKRTCAKIYRSPNNLVQKVEL